MPDLIAIAYGDETIAGQAAEELERRADELSIDPDAVGVVVFERDGGSCQLTTSRHPGATAAWSKFWGALLGVAMGECEMSGIDLSFREQVKGMLKPGTSVLFIVVGRVSPERAIEALSQYGGTALKCSLAKDGMAELRDALDGEHARI
jgi:uncharacterized membrane protein